MKINRTGYAQFVKKLDKSRNVQKANTGGEGSDNDTIELSQASMKIKEYADIMKTAESSNVDKVEAIKTKLASGTYKISSEELADRILAEIKSQMTGEK